MQGTPFNFFVQWHLTERCNLKCKHCYQHDKLSELSYNEVCRAINEINRTIKYWGTKYKLEMSPSIHFTGGEPLLYQDLFPVLDYCHGLGLPTSLMSNGTLITDSIARNIKDCSVEDVQVSLDGMESVHDSIRGIGSFRNALRGIQNLISQNVETNINLTLSRINMMEIDSLVGLALDIGISAVTFSRLVPCGSGHGLMKEMLSPAELKTVYDNLPRYRDAGIAVISRDPLYSISTIGSEIPDSDFTVAGCAAGVFGITITCDGSVMPCRRMDLIVGNITERSLRDIWSGSEVLWSLRDRKSYHGNCSLCSYWSICRGCRAVALAVSRANGEEDYLGPDPQCPYFKSLAR